MERAFGDNLFSMDFNHYKKFIVALMLLLSTPLLANKADFSLLHNFSHAQKGDYIVASINRNYTLLHIHDKTAHTLVVEEITIPAGHLPNKNVNWREWIKSGAPHNTSWIMYEIEPTTGKMLEFYSHTQHCWSETIDTDNFLATLLNLSTNKVPDNKRKKVGPAPMPGELDRRRVWHPPLYCDGKAVEGAKFDSWKSRWPNDGTELAGKTLEIYIPQKKGAYPSYFPYWIEVRGSVIKAKLRVVDAGKNLYSPKPAIPRRPPSMVDKGQVNEGMLSFRLKTPAYYKDFYLYATAIDNPWKTPINLRCTIEKTDDPHVIRLLVQANDAKTQLTDGQRYRFYAVPIENSNIIAQTPSPLQWSF